MIALVSAVLVSGMGVPENLIGRAAAAAPAPEPSVDGRAVPKKKVTKGAEDSVPEVVRRTPVWPKAGSAEVDLAPVGRVSKAGALPVKVGKAKGSELATVRVETLPMEKARELGGVGVAVRLTRADGGAATGKVRAEFSYAGFRDAYGGDFASRLQLLRLPACALQTPRPRSCVIRPSTVAASNDLRAGTLTADIEAAPAGKAQAMPPAEPSTPAKDRKQAAARAAEAALASQLATGSVYLLAAGLTGPNGNWGATDLKPSGTWQAGTSGGGFDYDLPLPEAPSPGGEGPGLSLQYDASSVDGQGRWTNNQSGVVGVGWNLNAGFIERRYRRCAVDNWYDPNTADLIWWAEELGTAGKALCWESPDENDGDSTTNDRTQSELVLSAGGRSAQIVEDRTSGTWKTVPDFGWKIEQLTGGTTGQPYWKVTNQEGQVWRFGYNRDAQWQTPYVGNEHDPLAVADEPCFDRYYNDDIPPTCTGAWRWNLDQEVDRNENVIDYSYTRETNYFCLPSCVHEAYRVLPYDRGGFLAEVSWGHNSQVAGSVPTTRTVFTTTARDGGDVPTDLYCATQAGCENDTIAFYSTRKLTSVRTESRDPASGAWDPVSRLDLAHQWIYQRTDFGPAFDPVLWLDTAQQTGLAASPPITLPPHDFDAVMLAGAMDYDTMSDWTNLLSWRMVPRVAAIANGMGGRIEVTYGQVDPCGGGKGRVGGNYLTDKTGDCFEVDMGSDPESGYETWTRYFKQLATKVVERDMVSGSPDMVHQYEFLGTPRWQNPIQWVELGLAPPASEWRGYGQVRTVAGAGSDPAGYTVTTQTFLRGSGQQVAHFENGTTLDAPALQGQLLQEQAWQMTTLSPRAYTEVKSTRYEYTIQSTGNGPGTQDPAFVVRTRERSREKVTGGGWRYTDLRTTYNADGLPNRVNNYGQDGVTNDNSCLTYTYARNTDPGQWLIGFPSVTEKRTGDNCTTGALIGRTVTLYDAGTDPATNKPSDGNATEVRSSVNASTVSTTKATFDDYGRTLTSTDPLGKTVTTAYSPTSGWPTNGTIVTNSLGHTTVDRTSRLVGETVSVTDANGKTVEFDYDALGRATALWKPGHPRGGGTPSATAVYDIAWNGGLGQPTSAIKTTVRRLLSGTGTSSRWLSSHTYEDGFGRPRESQTVSPAGGRIVTVTTYDARGLSHVISEPAHNTAQPGSGLLNPAVTDLPQWNKVLYDDQERPTAAISYHLGTELRRTTSVYTGVERAEVTPPVGAKTTTITDVFDRTVKVEEWADAGTHGDTTFDYDLNGNLSKITDANGNVRTFTTDWLGRRTAASDPDSGSTGYGYDLAGRLTWATNGLGQKVSTTYDDLGRRTAQWAGEAGSGTKLAEWTYDSVAKGQPATATRYMDGRTYTQAVTAYDDDYRRTATTLTVPAGEGALAGTYAFTASFDAAGNLREQGVPAAGGLPAETITHSYTDLGLVKGVSSGHSGGFTYVKDTTFTATGKLATRLLGGNGQVKRTLERDATTGWLARITTQTKADTGTPDTVQDDRYSYDTAGKITRVLDAASAMPGGTAGQSECYTYDGLRRLTAAWTTTTNACDADSTDGHGVDPYDQSYTYDKVGNLTSLTDNGQTAIYAYPAPGATAVRPNAVTSITRPGGTDSYAYDNAGQLTARTVGGEQGTLGWNELGQLTRATIDGQHTDMVYDADGQRLIRRAPDGTTTLYLDGTELTLTGGQVTAKRYYATSDGATIALRDGGGVRWLLSGLHGSQQLAVDATTGQVSRERYLPFGQRRGADDLPFTDRGFLGKTEDDSTGLTYLSARYYDPAIAKFVSTDPLLDLTTPQWANPYSYAGNDPIGQSDPDGLRPDHCGDGSGRAECTTTIQQKFAKRQPLTKAEVAEHVYNTHYSNLSTNQKQTVWMAWKAQTDPDAVNAWVKRTLAERDRRSAIMVRDFLWALFIDDYPECARGDALACAGVIPWGKAIGLPTRVIKKLAGKADDTVAAGRKADTASCSSFVPGTRVLMADGTTKAVEDVVIGDKVIATDPETGKTSAKPVIALLTSEGGKNLVQLTVDTDGARGDATGVIIATAEHPFWTDETRRWRPAGELRPGQWLRTSTGAQVRVSAVARWSTSDQRVHNLTVDGIHTYHVSAGTQHVLVHNAGPCPKNAWLNKADFSYKLVQKKYKSHAHQFGVHGNENKANVLEFAKKLKEHMAAPGTKMFRFKYHGQGIAIGFIDMKTGLMVMLRPNGAFWSSWKLGANQIDDIVRKGELW
ncbi:polymorphic toxin-type HINT domain-containing protein [Streptosporangium sp. H16]|uniref:polymorphic toxin-type HINT domain-containing protein n=1 Tax=Streptosporangium sp. H16 TaxID=3444184 RepID=UPI003F7AB237